MQLLEPGHLAGARAERHEQRTAYAPLPHLGGHVHPHDGGPMAGFRAVFAQECHDPDQGVIERAEGEALRGSTEALLSVAEGAGYLIHRLDLRVAAEGVYGAADFVGGSYTSFELVVL